MTTAVVAGALATKAWNGGNAWTRLTWLVALQRLGFDTWFVERVPAGPDVAGQVEWAWAALAAEAPGVGSIFLGPDDEVLAAGEPGPSGPLSGVLGPSGPLSGVLGPSGPLSSVAGMSAAEVVDEAGLLVNISGHLPGASVAGTHARVSVFLDDDPVYTQVWAESGAVAAGLADHDVHCTYGLNIGLTGCPVPTLGLVWHPLVPPVLLDRWVASPSDTGAPVTTVGTWRSPFGTLTHGADVYGGKHREFRKILDLPGHVDAAFALALDIHPAEVDDIAALAAHGWKVVEAGSVAGDAASYRRWVQGSAAELSAAQGAYVGTGCGWVSDRTAAYLAAGRPAVVQDTGAGRHLPVGEGLLVWRDLDEAVAGVEAVLADPGRHAAAARRLAAEHFDASAVAGRVCELAGVAP